MQTAKSTTEAAGSTLHGDVPRVTIFSKNNCARCVQVERKLEEKNIPFREINVQKDTEPRDEFGGLTPLDYIVARYSATEMPLIVVEGGGLDDHWSGIRPDKLIPLIERMRTVLQAADF